MSDNNKKPIDWDSALPLPPNRKQAAQRSELNPLSGSVKFRLLETGDKMHKGVEHLSDDTETWIKLDRIWYGCKYHHGFMPAREPINL